MLDAGTAIEVEVLVDLRLLLSLRRLVDRELDPLVPVRHHLRHQRTVLRRDVLVVEGDEILEAHHFLVEPDPDIHLAELHVADAVIHVLQAGFLRLEVRLLLHEPGHEQPAIVAPLDEGMNGVAVDADRRHHHFARVVLERARLVKWHGAALHCLLEGITRILHPERDVAHAVAMLVDVSGDVAGGA